MIMMTRIIHAQEYKSHIITILFLCGLNKMGTRNANTHILCDHFAIFAIGIIKRASFLFPFFRFYFVVFTTTFWLNPRTPSTFHK